MLLVSIFSPTLHEFSRKVINFNDLEEFKEQVEEEDGNVFLGYTEYLGYDDFTSFDSWEVNEDLLGKVYQELFDLGIPEDTCPELLYILTLYDTDRFVFLEKLVERFTCHRMYATEIATLNAIYKHIRENGIKIFLISSEE